MKKKRLSVVVATALMASLVVGMGAMTYSKYITSTSTGTQQATAANWGFVITADASKLFGDAYNSGVIVDYSETGSISVRAKTDNNLIVAPGTSGFMTIAVSGKAEVKAQFSLKQTEAKVEEIGIKTDTIDYKPIVWTLKSGSVQKAQGTLTQVLSSLTTVDPIVIEANDEYTQNYELSWEWPLETITGTTDEEKAASKKQNNFYDTIIGYKSYNKSWAEIYSYIGGFSQTDYETDGNISTKISFAFDVSIEQVQ